MRKTKRALKILITFTVFLVLVQNTFSASIGLSPGITEFKGVLRGDYSEKDVILSTSSSTPIECEIIASGPAEYWFTYSTGKKFTIQPQTHFALKIMVEPPADTPNAVYSGLIMVRIIPNTSISGTGAGLSTGVALKYNIEVSDQEKRSYKVHGVSLEYTREGIGYTEEKKPFNFNLLLENDGNVRLYPKIHIDILSEDKSTVLASKDYSEKLLLPTTKQEIVITIPNTLPIGKYFAKMTAVLPDNTKQEKIIQIEVVEKGSLSISGRLDQVKLNKIWVTPGELVEVKAVFTNDGVLSTPASFKGKVIRLNSEEEDTVLSLLESDEVEVAPGQTTEISTFYTPQAPGRYQITGKIRYSKKETGEKSSILNVIQKQDKPAETNATTPTQPTKGPDTALVAVIVLLIAIVIGFFLWRTRKKPTTNLETGKKKTKTPEEPEE